MRIALLCDDGLLLDGLKCLLATLPGCQVVASDMHWEGLEASSKKGAFEVVILATSPSAKEAAAIQRAKKRLGFQLVADLSVPTSDLAFSRSDGFESLKAALSSKGRDHASAVREPTVAYGVRKNLTPREREVARLVSQGMPNRRIATVLGIQEQSVKNLVSVVMRKLRCENRVQLALHLSSAKH